MVIPRPHSFLFNGLLFAAGLLFARLEGYGGGAEERFGLSPWVIIPLWFVVQEIFVQQAKYMWNDIRDHDGDQLMPANQVRPIARVPLSTTITAIMLVRWILGIVLAGLLAPVLLTLVLMISGLQMLYELVAKPQAMRWPILPLFIVAAGMVLKTCSGALALGVPPGEQRMWLYGVAMFATGIVFISSFWRSEATYFRQRSLALPRNQSHYYAYLGRDWLKAGTAVTLAACLLLICDGYRRFLTVVDIGSALALGLIIVTGTAGSSLAFTLVRAGNRVRFPAILLFICAGFTALIWGVDRLFPIPRATMTAVLLLILLLADYSFNVNLDYQQQNLIYLRQNWPLFRQLLRSPRRRPAEFGWWLSLLPLIVALNSVHYGSLHERYGNKQEVRQPERSFD